MSPPRRTRGYVLVLTLLLCGLSFAILLYSAPGAPLFGFSRDDSDRDAAWDAAAGAQEAALAGLLYNVDLPSPPAGSASGTPQVQDLVVPSGGPRPATGQVTFQPAAGLPYSTSNYTGPAAVQGWQGRTIPPGYVHLVALGRLGASTTGEVRETRQAMVRPVVQYLFEDFDADGNGSKARQTWTALPHTSGYLFQDRYLFLGNPQYQHNKVQFLRSGMAAWTDYDLEAHVAYYGNASFGFCFRVSDGFEGYMLEMQPRIGLEQVDGMDMTVTALISDGTETIPYPVAEQVISDPIFVSATDLSTAPVEWTLRVSVQGTQVWLSARDPATGLFRAIGTAFDLGQFSAALKAKGYPAVFPAGQVGFWCQVDTGVGLTNVIVNKRGAPMLDLPAQWSR